ncbi:MAG: DUF4350 domain-containing protein [Thermodesulfobacteriota bacterium]
MKKTLIYAALLAIFVPLFLNAPASSKLPEAARLKNSRPATSVPDLEAAMHGTVFDGSHGEIFSPVNNGELDYSGFYDMLKASGAQLSINKGPVTTKTLADAGTYIIAGPTQKFTHAETGALHTFINNGGNLLVMLHISSPVAQLTESFGILVSNFVISEQTDLIEGLSQDFYVKRFAPHPVTRGLKKVAVYGTWGLLAQGAAKEVATTSDKAWADMDRNRKLDEGEPVQKFAIIAVATYGAGKVVVVADDAPFANRFLDEADNHRLAGNIIEWFGR